MQALRLFLIWALWALWSLTGSEAERQTLKEKREAAKNKAGSEKGAAVAQADSEEDTGDEMMEGDDAEGDDTGDDGDGEGDFKDEEFKDDNGDDDDDSDADIPDDEELGEEGYEIDDTADDDLFAEYDDEGIVEKKPKKEKAQKKGTQFVEEDQEGETFTEEDEEAEALGEKYDEGEDKDAIAEEDSMEQSHQESLRAAIEMAMEKSSPEEETERQNGLGELAQRAMVDIDTDRDGEASLDEMIADMVRKTSADQIKLPEKVVIAVKEIYSEVDSDGDGKIGVYDLVRFLDALSHWQQMENLEEQLLGTMGMGDGEGAAFNAGEDSPYEISKTGPAGGSDGDDMSEPPPLPSHDEL